MPMPIKDAVVQRFRQLCKERGITWNELAVRAGVMPSSVYSMADGRRRELSISLIKKLCDGLDLTLEEFFNTPTFDELEQEIK